VTPPHPLQLEGSSNWELCQAKGRNRQKGRNKESNGKGNERKGKGKGRKA